MPSRTKPVDPLAGSEIPVEWESLDQNISVSDDQNVTYWMDSFENKWLMKPLHRMECKPKPGGHGGADTCAGEEAVIAGASIIPQANVGVNGSRSKGT